MMNRSHVVLSLFVLLVPALIPAAQAQQYPNRPIRLVIPWPPGGITDVVSRAIGSVLSESLGQQVVPDNRPGAAGTIGVAITAHANPDGYTLMMTDTPSHAISASLYRKLSYKPATDIEPVALPSRSPLVLVVNPRIKVNTIQELISRAKSQPGKQSFASSGPGSITHLAAERFVRDTGTRMLHVPYKGGGPATAAVASGEADMYLACIAAAIPHIKAGRLRLLGITLPARTPLFPDTPAVAEVIPGYVMGCNTGFFGTAGTPAVILDRLHAEVMKAVATPRVKKLLDVNAAEPAPYTRAQFKQHVADEIKSWGEVVRAAKLTVN